LVLGPTIRKCDFTTVFNPPWLATVRRMVGALRRAQIGSLIFPCSSQHASGAATALFPNSAPPSPIAFPVERAALGSCELSVLHIASECDLPLPKSVKGGILASKSPGISQMSG
jgi:hypothetical protein